MARSTAALDPADLRGPGCRRSPPGQASGPALDRLGEEFEDFFDLRYAGGGSNNWTVAGSRTATGRPILAKIRISTARLPPHWYLIQVRTPQWAIAVSDLPGGAAVHGRPQRFCRLGQSPRDYRQYRSFSVNKSDPMAAACVRAIGSFPAKWSATKSSPSAASPRYRLSVLITLRGPIVSPALGVPLQPCRRAVWLDPRPARRSCSLFPPFAASPTSARPRSIWPAASWNMVYADQTGHHRLASVRTVAPETAQRGQLIARARDGCGCRLGAGPSVPSERIAARGQIRPQGFLATANNQPLPDGVGPFLGVRLDDGYLVATIAANECAAPTGMVPRISRLANESVRRPPGTISVMLRCPLPPLHSRYSASDGNAADLEWACRPSIRLPRPSMSCSSPRWRAGWPAPSAATFAYVLGEPLGPIAAINFLAIAAPATCAASAARATVRLVFPSLAGRNRRCVGGGDSEITERQWRRYGRLGFWPLTHAHACIIRSAANDGWPLLQPWSVPLRRRRRHHQSRGRCCRSIHWASVDNIPSLRSRHGCRRLEQ